MSRELTNNSLSRRRLLQAGGIGALGLSLPALLRAEDAGATAKSCIFIHQYGGLSQLDSWDMKPDAPQEIRGPYRPIRTATPGFQICELMPRLAKLSGQYAVIRSMTHKLFGIRDLILLITKPLKVLEVGYFNGRGIL